MRILVKFIIFFISYSFVLLIIPLIGYFAHDIRPRTIKHFYDFITRDLLPAIPDSLDIYERDFDDQFHLAREIRKKHQPMLITESVNREQNTKDLLEHFHKVGQEYQIIVIIIRKDPTETELEAERESVSRTIRESVSLTVRESRSRTIQDPVIKEEKETKEKREVEPLLEVLNLPSDLPKEEVLNHGSEDEAEPEVGDVEAEPTEAEDPEIGLKRRRSDSAELSESSAPPSYRTRRRTHIKGEK